MRVAIASSSLLALPIIEELSKLSEVELVGFISTPDQPKGRSGKPTPNEFAGELEERGFHPYKPASGSALLDALDALAPDLVVVIAYGRLVKSDALKKPRFGWINLHFSLLPAYRGAAPVQRSLMDGSKLFGFSIFKLDEGMDTGPFYVKEEVPIENDLPATEILDELARRSAGSFRLVIEDIRSGRVPRPQEGTPSFAPKIQKQELHLNLALDGQTIYQRVLALTKKPGVWFTFKSKRLVINRAIRSASTVPPFHFKLEKGVLLLGLNGLTLALLSLTPEGKREMSGEEFARGLRMSEGQLLRIEE